MKEMLLHGRWAEQFNETYRESVCASSGLGDKMSRVHLAVQPQQRCQLNPLHTSNHYLFIVASSCLQTTKSNPHALIQTVSEICPICSFLEDTTPPLGLLTHTVAIIPRPCSVCTSTNPTCPPLSLYNTSNFFTWLIFSEHQTPEMKTLLETGNHWPNDIASHIRRVESTATHLSPQILHLQFC
jgi:hypothetical protein